MSGKPFSPACERNREPILTQLRPLLSHCARVLEIGSGTGQHAVHFARAMPWLQWQCSDLPGALPGIELWMAEAGLPNTPPPIALDVDGPWPAPPRPFDAVFSANTLHIMSWPQVERMFEGLPSLTADSALLLIYGPFTEHGRHTSQSNADFDAALRARAPHMGVRDAADVDRLAAAAGFELQQDLALPANNRLRVWRRRGPV